MTASNQWATRPPDERFWNLSDMHKRVTRYRQEAQESKNVLLSDMHVEADSNDLTVVGKAGVPVKFTHWSFGQLSNLVGAPASYLRKLPPGLAADCLNKGLQTVDADKRVKLLLNVNGDRHLRAATGPDYARIWNCTITPRLLDLESQGWRVPPARPNGSGVETRIATEEDCLKNRMPGLGIKPGDVIAPAGLYASDKDMFAFMVNEDREIGNGRGGSLFRGFFVGNSEVGDKAFWLIRFLYNAVCGNHIVWGAEKVSEIKVVHRGNKANAKAAASLGITIKHYADSANEETKVIERAMSMPLGADMTEVVDYLFGKKIAGRKVLQAAYVAAEEHPEDSGESSPNTVWGMTQGLTRVSQESAFADSRVAIDMAAGKVLQMAF